MEVGTEECRRQGRHHDRRGQCVRRWCLRLSATLHSAAATPEAPRFGVIRPPIDSIVGAATMSLPPKRITPDQFDAVLFDLDGVLTSTAKIHARCWKTMFDDFLNRRAAELKESFRPFDIETDYKLYVDGKLR